MTRDAPEPAWPEAGPIVRANSRRQLKLLDYGSATAMWLPDRWLSWPTTCGRCSHTFETFHATTLQLLARTNHPLSATKGWLHPRSCVAAPESDAGITPIFRAQPPPQSNLASRSRLMPTTPRCSAAIARELESHSGYRNSTAPGQTTRSGCTGYFVPSGPPSGYPR